LKITDKGKAFMKKPFKVEIVEDNDYSNIDTDDDEEFINRVADFLWSQRKTNADKGLFNGPST